MASEMLHERPELLSERTRDMHRALTSLKEELEAIDWYQQRADACTDPALKEVLLHNKNEEIEHASMLIEWVRRNSEKFDEFLRRFVFTEKPITGLEPDSAGDDTARPDASA